MKTLRVLLFLSLPIFVVGEYLDDYCNTIVWVESGTTTYSIRDGSSFRSQCKVDFDILESRKVQLTISGFSLHRAGCKVNVYGSSDVHSQTGNIAAVGPFTRSVTSDDTGQLYLHVMGPRCDSYRLTFQTSTLCTTTEFTCHSGQCVFITDHCDGYNDCDDGSDEDGCFWGVGAYVGISIGALVLVLIVVALSAVYYRRRLVVVQYPALIPAGQTAVNHQYAATSVSQTVLKK